MLVFLYIFTGSDRTFKMAKRGVEYNYGSEGCRFESCRGHKRELAKYVSSLFFIVHYIVHYLT